ncbi:alpha/beta fold hydrolase [Zhihengliuella sp.]|uniref:alpha/beta fold hydrolase n=1 Tax=Zhihengliuella sp. TaxID=1954483 RepID=UPI002811219E|nr:alpha/beta fold hydrolase [Zhihengliuella sp.]
MTDVPHLTAHLFAPEGAETGRPVLLIHGFASSTELNWVTTGWVKYMNYAGRRVVAVDLPGHGQTPLPGSDDGSAEAPVPSLLRAGIRQAALEALGHAGDLAGAGPGDRTEATDGLVDVVGYSFGARLAWGLAADYPELVHRLCLGGAAATDPLADFDVPEARAVLASGDETEHMTDPMSDALLQMAQLVPSNDVDALLQVIEAVGAEPFVPGESVPQQPVLLVAGQRDELAETMPRLTELARVAGGAEELWLPARTHSNAVTSRAFKQAALEHFAS